MLDAAAFVRFYDRELTNVSKSSSAFSVHVQAIGEYWGSLSSNITVCY